MIAIKKQSAIKFPRGYKLIISLLALFVLSASFKKDNKVCIAPPAINAVADTLSSTANAKLRMPKIIIVNNKLVLDNNETTPADQQSTVLNNNNLSSSILIPVTDPLTSLHARAQLKAYMDNLIVDPKSPGLINDANLLITRKP